MGEKENRWAAGWGNACLVRGGGGLGGLLIPRRYHNCIDTPCLTCCTAEEEMVERQGKREKERVCGMEERKGDCKGPGILQSAEIDRIRIDG